MNHYTYRAIIEPDENNTYHGYVPALNGCHTWGDSIDEVRANLRDAISVYLASLEEDNEAIPLDRGLEFLETITMPATEKSTPVYA